MLVNNLNINTELPSPLRYLLLIVNALSFYHKTFSMRAQFIGSVCCIKIHSLFWNIHEGEEGLQFSCLDKQLIEDQEDLFPHGKSI